MQLERHVYSLNILKDKLKTNSDTKLLNAFCHTSFSF